MKNILIKKLDNKNKAPLSLLLLADPSIEIIKDYLCRGECYIASIDNEVVGVYILLKRSLRR